MAKPKTLSPEDEFTAIGEEAVRRAEQVKCSFEAFVDGLRDIESEIRSRRVLAEDELEKQRGEQ